MTTLFEQLDELENLMAHADLIRLDEQLLIDGLLRPEIRARMIEIEAEFEGLKRAADENIRILTERIKEHALALGASASGSHLQAIFIKGEVTWDSERLDGYALSHPKLLALRKEGEPSVTIRKRG